MRMRPVNSGDLAAAMSARDSRMRERCCWRGRFAAAAREALRLRSRRKSCDWLDRFERLNASAEIRCMLPCRDAGSRRCSTLILPALSGVRVTVAARRLLAEIHRLARAYGWSEQAIVAMSAPRRAVTWRCWTHERSTGQDGATGARRVACGGTIGAVTVNGARRRRGFRGGRPGSRSTQRSCAMVRSVSAQRRVSAAPEGWNP